MAGGGSADCGVNQAFGGPVWPIIIPKSGCELQAAPRRYKDFELKTA